MSLSLWIPAWLLWMLGIVAGLVVIGLAVLGVMFLFFLRDFNRSMSRAWGWW